jgi:hypothetical protein
VGKKTQRIDEAAVCRRAEGRADRQTLAAIRGSPADVVSVEARKQIGMPLDVVSGKNLQMNREAK